MFVLRTRKLALLTTLFIFTVLKSEGQAIIDGFMKKPGEGTVALSYSNESYDEFSFGSMKVDAPAPVGGKVNTQSVGIFADYGLFKNINLVVNAPYIRVQGNGDDEIRDQDMSGFQNISAFVKWRPYESIIGNGKLTVIGAIGVATPLSDYDDNDLLSIGNGATTGSFKGLVQYKVNSGLFANFQAGYDVRNNNAPSAVSISGKLGYASSRFYVDVCILSQVSDSDAPDIDPASVPFFETRVNYTQIGINGYYPISNKLGLSAGFFQYLSARNTSLSTGYSGGIIYNFRASK